MIELLLICILMFLPVITAFADTEADKICGLYYVVDKFTSGEQCKVRIYRNAQGT